MPTRLPFLAFLAFAVLTLTACSGAEPAAETTLPPTTTSDAGTTTSTVAGTTSTTAPPPTTTTTVGAVPVTISVSYVNGDVEGPTRPEVAVGTLVQLLVTSDLVDKVHLHGYDIKADVGPDTAALLEFVADTPGIFEVELEDEGFTLLEIEVR